MVHFKASNPNLAPNHTHCYLRLVKDLKAIGKDIDKCYANLADIKADITMADGEHDEAGMLLTCPVCDDGACS